MTITLGTTTEIDTSTANAFDVAKLTSSLAICIYGDGNDWFARTLSISGTTITVNAEATVDNTEGTAVSRGGIVRLTDTSALAVIQNSTSSEVTKAVVLTVSGTTITVNTLLTLASSKNEFAVAGLDSTNVMIAYRHGVSLSHRARILSISGTTVTENSETNYKSADAESNPKIAAFDSSNVIAVYENNGDSSTPYGVILSVSGTTITANTEKQIDSAAVRSVGSPSIGRIHVSERNSTTCIFGFVVSSSSLVRMAVLTISGSTFNIGSTTDLTPTTNLLQGLAMFTDGAGVAYQIPSSGDLDIIEFTISGTTITEGENESFAGNNSNGNGDRIAGLDSTHVIAVSGSSIDGTVIELDSSTISYLWHHNGTSWEQIDDPGWTNPVNGIVVKKGDSFDTVIASVATDIALTTDRGATAYTTRDTLSFTPGAITGLVGDNGLDVVAYKGSTGGAVRVEKTVNTESGTVTTENLTSDHSTGGSGNDIAGIA